MLNPRKKNGKNKQIITIRKVQLQDYYTQVQDIKELLGILLSCEYIGI